MEPIKYKLLKNHRFRCAWESFELKAGSIVYVIQKDAHCQVLIQFDKKSVDWYDESILTLFEKV